MAVESRTGVCRASIISIPSNSFTRLWSCWSLDRIVSVHDLACSCWVLEVENNSQVWLTSTSVLPVNCKICYFHSQVRNQRRTVGKGLVRERAGDDRRMNGLWMYSNSAQTAPQLGWSISYSKLTNEERNWGANWSSCRRSRNNGSTKFKFMNHDYQFIPSCSARISHWMEILQVYKRSFNNIDCVRESFIGSVSVHWGCYFLNMEPSVLASSEPTLGADLDMSRGIENKQWLLNSFFLSNFTSLCL